MLYFRKVGPASHKLIFFACWITKAATFAALQYLPIAAEGAALTRGKVVTIKRLLLLSGPVRSGKSSVAQVLKTDHGFHGISTGGYLRSYVRPGAGDITRSWLQDLGDQLDLKTDFAWVVDSVAIPAVKAAPATESWLLDAVRKPRQVEHFRAQFPYVVRHVHLHAPESVLQARYGAGLSSGDPIYSLAIAHPNEVAARSLGIFADQIFDTEQASASEIAEQIVSLWRE
ncbi:hypothetical protein [Burkholderia cenocepacia]|uniref:hypothetical protein n=1 Tax=Burkholderia cenocepacia TaxID=95486 RepID=UPI001ABAA45B|nr:hypothetical protein [Burkholderia cenocepacia]